MSVSVVIGRKSEKKTIFKTYVFQAHRSLTVVRLVNLVQQNEQNQQNEIIF